jgi:hypothetical protein
MSEISDLQGYSQLLDEKLISNLILTDSQKIMAFFPIIPYVADQPIDQIVHQ